MTVPESPAAAQEVRRVVAEVFRPGQPARLWIHQGADHDVGEDRRPQVRVVLPPGGPPPLSP